MTQVAKALERLRPWLPLRENASFSGAFDAVYSGAHADVVTLWQDALFREQKFEEQKQSLDEEWGAQPKDSQRRFFDPLYEKVRELEAEKGQLEAALAREERKVELLTDKVDEWFASADHWRDKAEQAQQDRIEAEKRRDDWERSYDCLLEVQNKDELTVTKHDIEAAVREGADHELADIFYRDITDAVWSLVSGSDPAVYVVRESDIAAVKVTEHAAGWSAESEHLVSGWGKGKHLSVDMDFDRYRAVLLNALAVQRAIEAEQAVDPAEEKARELYRAATPDARWETVADEYRRIARHVLGQEASDE